MFDDALRSIDPDAARADLEAVGYHQLSVRLPHRALAEVVRQMDDLCASNVELEVNYAGSEHRIWHAETHFSSARAFRAFSDAVILQLDPDMGRARNILAIRNRPLATDSGQLRTGRWHLDSFRKQLKIFVFMQDVGENDGPFELIPRTQNISAKIKHIIPGRYFSLKDIVQRAGTRGYQHIDEGFIAAVEKTYPSKLFTVPAGTILIADTSAIHRAHPVNGGARYAFTSYH
ncbi:hypothetical protein [Gymnodinialimonas ceratoperidinii]|uniref:Phytanoyl-CoA dioxygenase n=1 Tax=Gymnodinialimonas ceratoperidinii TaxID=2856823 RepID=A0A8F6TVT5_9RHOB|nr:hypothetical protein [Gymnodinialimonas ceratoperidinii]QXT39388.1 hypothetical protein KYE46_15895 [Gymnodinialimonas ceratoperidinii]